MNVKDYIKENTEELYELLHTLCLIPAPSNKEELRAEFCHKWFLKNGMTDAYIDEAKNVIFPYQVKDGKKLTVFAAHTDTVFPDLEPMPYVDDGEYIHCPGVGDDTASVAVLMLVARYFVRNNIKTDGVLFVCNSCEEGLGNLKGVRQLFNDCEGRVANFVSFDDSKLTHGVDECVGSHRYEVELTTPGGHSFMAFGNENAIAEISKIINGIYSITPPEKAGKRVTYNVGMISGGTSVNTIAQDVKMLCEYRSDDKDLLAYMKAEFERIFKSAETDRVKVSVKLVGDRPCASDVPPEKMERLRSIHRGVVREVIGAEVIYTSGSTDGNIPLSLGIPAVTVGVYNGDGVHTRKEKLEKKSLIPGLEIGLKFALNLTEI